MRQVTTVSESESKSEERKNFYTAERTHGPSEQVSQQMAQIPSKTGKETCFEALTRLSSGKGLNKIFRKSFL